MQTQLPHHHITKSSHHQTIASNTQLPKMSEQHPDTPESHVGDSTGLNPQPENALDHEIQAIPPDSDPRIVYIRLSYDWHEEPDIDQQDWQPHLLAFGHLEFARGTLEHIADYVHRRLERLAPTACQRLDQAASRIVLQLTLQSTDKASQ